MANKYAVATGVWSNTATRSDTDGGGGGAAVPADGDAVIVSTAVTLTVDVDLSAWTTGVAGITIRGGVTPGMLAFKSDADGTYYLKIKSATNIVGTTSTNRGRLFMAGGTWASPSDAAFGRKMVIEFLGTAAGELTCTNLDVIARCSQPTNLYLRTYGTIQTVVSVTPATDIIDVGAAPPAAGTAVRITSSGTLPGGLEEDVTYYVRAVSGNTCKLATQNADAQIVDITSTGSGTIRLYTGYASGSQDINVLEDVTADTPWTTGTTDGNVVLCNEGPQSYDQQRVYLDTIAAGAVNISANVDSTQFPGAKLVLVSRNVRILSNSTGGTTQIINAGTGLLLQCEIRNVAGSGTTFYNIGINAGTGHTIAGVLSGLTYGLSGGTSHNISGVIVACSNALTGAFAGGTGAGNIFSGLIDGCMTGLNTTVSILMSGKILGCTNGFAATTTCTMTGTIRACNLGITGGRLDTVSETIQGCGSGINLGSAILTGARLIGNTTADLNAIDYCEGYGAALLSGTQNTGYAKTVPDAWRTNCIYDIADAAGAPQTGQIKAWMPGGTVLTEAAPGSPPVTLPYAYKMLGESASRDVFVAIPIWAKANQQLDVTIYEKCNEDPDNWDVGPTFELINPGYLYGDAAAVLDSATAKVDGGDDTNWHTIVLSCTPATDRPLILLSRARDATAYYHWMFSPGPSDAEIASAVWVYDGAEGRTLTA